MALVTFQGNSVETDGSLPEIGASAPDFKLVKGDLSDVSLQDLAGQNIVLNIFPSIDTSVCAASVRRFNEAAGGLEDTVVLCVSADLPFAQGRFCGAEGLDDVVPVSTFRSPEFGKDYGTGIVGGALDSLQSRAVVIIGKDGNVIYTEHVAEITDEPDYEAALTALK